MCLTPKEREMLVSEFWTRYRAMHDHKRAGRSKKAANLAETFGKLIEQDIFDQLSNSEIFEIGAESKKVRKALEQKWSFNEIIGYLAKHSPPGLNLDGVEGLLHMYGMQSHLIHADEAALGLMLDRTQRKPEELLLLEQSHVCRIFSDQASLWYFSTKLLSHRYGGRTSISVELHDKWEELHNLIQYFTDGFSSSQEEFYFRYQK